MDIKRVYKQYAERGLDSAQQLGWNDLETQDQFMKLMVDLVHQHLPLPGRSVHDAGCGYGDLVPYLEKQVGSPPIASYVGTDLMAESVKEAQKRHPAYHFFQRDLLVDEVPEADVTICMGALAFHKAPEAIQLLERLWSASKHALAFNCWWDLTPAYQHYWEAGKVQKRVQSWLKDKKAAMLSGYADTERMFLVLKE